MLETRRKSEYSIPIGFHELTFVTTSDDEQRPKRCIGCRQIFNQWTIPLRTEYNPLPNNPSLCQRLKFAFLCPPHGVVGAFMFLVITFCTWWGVLIAVTDKASLPGGNLFALLILFFLCWFGGYLITWIRLPPLLGVKHMASDREKETCYDHMGYTIPQNSTYHALCYTYCRGLAGMGNNTSLRLIGMLITGVLVNNIPSISFGRETDHHWSGNVRQVALTVILTRAGLGLDPKALRRLSWVVLRLAFTPCIMEMLTIGIAAHFILEFPWLWGFMLGFVLAAVSPGIVVPSLLGLQHQGYGVDEGVPTLVIAAASIDDVLAITGFGLLLGITFVQNNLWWGLLKGPVEVIIGLTYGLIVGVTLWYIPHKSNRHLVLFRATLLMGFGLMAILLSIYFEWAGVGPLGCLSVAFVAALKWRKEVGADDKNPIEDVVDVLWMIAQPLLFGLIGAAIDLNDIKLSTVAKGMVTICIGLIIRMFVAFLVVSHTKLTVMERVFVAIAWIPKATVQAAIGGLALDQAVIRRDNGIKNEDEMKYGEEILTIAVLSVLFSAPVGSSLMAIFGPRLLPMSKMMVVETVYTQQETAKGDTLLPADEQEPIKPSVASNATPATSNSLTSDNSVSS